MSTIVQFPEEHRHQGQGIPAGASLVPVSVSRVTRPVELPIRYVTPDGVGDKPGLHSDGRSGGQYQIHWATTFDFRSGNGNPGVPIFSNFICDVAFVADGPRKCPHGWDKSKIFDAVYSGNAALLRKLLAGVWAKIGKSVRRSLDLEDLFQEVVLEMRVLCTRRPMDLFGTEIGTRRLLACMVRRVVTNQLRKTLAKLRDFRRTVSIHGRQSQMVLPRVKEMPLETMARADLCRKYLGMLKLREQRLVLLRVQNYSWQEIAGCLGGSPDGNRMALLRVMAKLRARLDPEDGF